MNSPYSAFPLHSRAAVDFLPQPCSPQESSMANKTILDHLQLLLLIDCHWAIPHCLERTSHAIIVKAKTNRLPEYFCVMEDSLKGKFFHF